MKAHQLILESKNDWKKSPDFINGVVSPKIFDLGAKWMFNKLNEKGNIEKRAFNDLTNYWAYGILKYGLCLFAFLISIFLFFKIHILLTPLSILVFYLFEIHLLFLFPLLIDNVKNPIWTSVKQTYKIGLFTALITVIPIGFYMVIGLFNFNNPFRNWYIGCLAIIIWYENDIRNRL